MTLNEAIELTRTSAYWGTVLSIVMGSIFFLIIVYFMYRECKEKNSNFSWLLGSIVPGILFFICVLIFHSNINEYKNPRAYTTHIDRRINKTLSDYHWELVPTEKKKKNNQAVR